MWAVDIDVSSVKTALNDLGLEPNGATQYFFTNELMRLSNNYIPFNNGVLSASAMVTQGGTSILYNTPYAKYHWYGKLAVDPITGKGAFFKEGYGFWSRPNTKKVISDGDMQYQGAPMRGPRWVERCFIDNKENLIQATQKFAEEQIK